ncbi:hypothetical protein FOZ76_02790 [Verticiella sediminum]|uniref:NADH:flavin oxidoreductase/NADH oxidase N-terminal domain-containing protein n=2 Tax=Verticiella sediminum TaxID=1247510 RepID=A0A556AZF7_9BURK|nr:hypothetical protein FOZ76_02790 [Verticiella sediminum]
MTTGDIADVVASYARAAGQAEALGFDGVEIHAAHEFLLDTFLWEDSNTRTDAYGGSLEKRLRLTVEVVQELGRILKPLAKAGVDVLHASAQRFWEPAFAGSLLSLAGWAHKLTGKPAVAVSSVGLRGAIDEDAGAASSAPADLHGAAERIEAGEFDLIAVGRALLLADPGWTDKVGQGRFDELRGYDAAILERPLF